MEKLICIACPIGCHLEIDVEDDYKVTGNQCKRGPIYAKKELTNPTRIVTSTVIIEGGTKTLQNFIDLNLWDEARVFIAENKILDGVKSPDFNFTPEKTIKIKNEKNKQL